MDDPVLSQKEAGDLDKPLPAGVASSDTASKAPEAAESVAFPGIPETIIVPPAGSPAESSQKQPPSPLNPFIPQGTVTPEAQTTNMSSGIDRPPIFGDTFWPRRILMVGVFLVIFAALAFGAKFVLELANRTEEVTLTYWGLWENEAVMQGVIADFEAENPKIKIEYSKQNPRQYRERLQAVIGRGEGPDVFRFHNTWVPMLKKELALSETKIFAASDLETSFYPVVAGDLSAGESVYGVPLMIDGLGLYYNEDLFTAAGVVPPTTWPEVLALAPKLTVKNENAIITSAIALGTANNVEHFSDILALMFMQNGANLTDLSGKEAEETLIFYRKFADPADPVYSWNEDLDNSIMAFANGRVAMILAPSWRAFEINAINPNLHFKISPVPQLPGNNIAWASYWVEGVSAKSKHQSQSWQFIKYLTGREAVTKLYTEAAKSRLFGEPYALEELGSSLIGDPYVGAFIKQAAVAKSFPLSSRTFDNGINDKLIKYLEDAVNGLAKGSSPQSVLQTVTAGFHQVLGSYGLTSGVAPAQSASP